MKTVIGRCWFGFGVAFFIGYVIISVGIGSVCPALYRVAAPLVCRDGQSLKVEQQYHSWRPGANMWTARIYRVGPGIGKKDDCTIAAKLATGVVYGLVIFALMLPRLFRKTGRSGTGPSADGQQETGAAPGDSIDEKLAKIKQLHEDDLISAEEYEQKKAEILNGI